MSAPAAQCVHGTCVEIGGIGMLLVGAPGSGKSDLALRLIDTEGFGTGDHLLRTRLVSDDQTVLRCEKGRLVASAPSSIAGRLEVRGIGILKLDYAPECILSAVVRLVPGQEVERHPDTDACTQSYCGMDVPRYDVSPFEVSAPQKLRALASDFLLRGNQQAVHSASRGRT